MEFNSRLLMLSQQCIQTVQVEFFLVIISANPCPSLPVFFKEIHLPHFYSSLWLTTFSDKQMTHMGLNTWWKSKRKPSRFRLRPRYCAPWWDWQCCWKTLWQPTKQCTSGWIENQQRQDKNHAHKLSKRRCTTKSSWRTQSCRRF